MDVSEKEFNIHLKELKAYLKEWYISDDDFLCDVKYLFDEEIRIGGIAEDYPGLERYIDNLDDSFGEKVKKLSAEKKLKRSELIDLTGISRSALYRMLSGEVHPAKDHCVEIALVLKLSYDEALDLLGSAEYTLSRSNARDMAFKYIFEKRIYDMCFINELLENMGMQLLGNVIE